MPSSPRSHRLHGFTLIELLVVVAIIVLLIAMLVPALEKAIKQANIAVCASQQHNLGIAHREYLLSSKGRLPYLGGYYRLAQINYLIYEFNVPPQGFVGLGLLAHRDLELVNPQSDVWFCPLNSIPAFQQSEGDPRHANALPYQDAEGNTTQDLQPADKEKYGWINKRSSYMRRLLGETSPTDAIAAASIGPKALFADVFPNPATVKASHGDSVNVAYTDGHASTKPIDVNDSEFSKTSSGFNTAHNARLEAIWRTWDGG